MRVSRRQVVASLLCLALVACGPSPIAWKPAGNTKANRIAKKAMFVENTDVDSLYSAGGEPAGMLTYRTDEYTVDTITESAGGEAAQHGGTHYTLGKWKEQAGPSEYHVRPAFGGYVVSEDHSTMRNVQILVIRVPPSGWRILPERLRPEAYD